MVRSSLKLARKYKLDTYDQKNILTTKKHHDRVDQGNYIVDELIGGLWPPEMSVKF